MRHEPPRDRDLALDHLSRHAPGTVDVIGTANRDVVVTFSTDTWSDAVQRDFCRPPEQLVFSVRDDERVGRLLVADAFRSRVSQVANVARRRSAAGQAGLPDDGRTALVRPRQLSRRLPATESEARHAARRYDAALAHAVRSNGLTRPVVITSNVIVAGFASLDWASRVVFYARDDWAAKAKSANVAHMFEAAYAEIRRGQRPLAAVSEVLLARLAPSAPSIVVPNGIDPVTWSPLAAMPAELESLPRPIVAYAGTINDRLDPAAIAALAPTVGSVLLLGPLGHQHPMDQLGSLPGVHYLGSLSQRRLSAVLQHVDACIMPHHRTDLTEAMCPLKLMNYLAAGQPVAATDLPANHGHGDRVILVDAEGDWPESVSRALSTGRASEAERLRFISENSWRVRHKALIDLALAPDSVDWTDRLDLSTE